MPRRVRFWYSALSSSWRMLITQNFPTSTDPVVCPRFVASSLVSLMACHFRCRSTAGMCLSSASLQRPIPSMPTMESLRLVFSLTGVSLRES